MTSLSEEGRALPGDDQAVKAAIEHWQRAEKWKAEALSAQQRLEQAVECLRTLRRRLSNEQKYRAEKSHDLRDSCHREVADFCHELIRAIDATLDDNAPEQERE